MVIIVTLLITMIISIVIYCNGYSVYGDNNNSPFCFMDFFLANVFLLFKDNKNNFGLILSSTHFYDNKHTFNRIVGSNCIFF